MVDRDPYLTRPPWARWFQLACYIGSYALTGVAGGAAGVLIDEWPAEQGGWTLVLASAIAIIGVSTRYYNLELVALWPVVGGLLACIVWLIMNDAILTGWLVGALIPWLLNRLLVLSLIARNARALHEAVVG